MTLTQLAIAARAEVKWILNSAALLSRPVRYTPSDAKWWGLLRLLTDTLGLSLEAAADSATRALSGNAAAGSVAVMSDASGSTSVLVDVPRYRSIFLANLSRALVQETPRRRGRPPRRQEGKAAVDSARRYGVDLGLVKAALMRTPAMRLEILEANAAFIRGMRRRAA